jgi:hypothetical protein
MPIGKTKRVELDPCVRLPSVRHPILKAMTSTSLTLRRQKFVSEYVETGNATEAARLAGGQEVAGSNPVAPTI